MVRRDLLILAVAVGLGLSFPSLIASQQHVVPDGFCAYYSPTAPTELYTFKPDPAATKLVNDIVSIAGLQQNFSLNAANVPLAAGGTKDRDRLVFYNQYPTAQKEEQVRWRLLTVLTHQVGHHLFRHEFSADSRRSQEELEADKFSGTVPSSHGGVLGGVHGGAQ